MLAPPSEAGAANVIVACWSPAVAEPMVGAPGAIAGRALYEGKLDFKAAMKAAKGA